FRGSFHVGVLGALGTLGIKPTLIAGASVGSLMGAAYGAMWLPDDGSKSASGPPRVAAVLDRLVFLFHNLGERVGLTRQLVEAVSQFRLRAYDVHLTFARMTQRFSNRSKDNP